MKKVTFFILGLSALLLFSCSENTTTDNNENAEAVAMPSLEELQKDDDIIWMGEVYVDCSPNFNTYENREELKKIGFTERNTYKVLKYQLTDIDATNYDDHLIFSKILNNLDQLDCFKDDKLTEKLTSEELSNFGSSVDTIVYIHPETSAEIRQVVVNDLDPNDIKLFRLKQLVYYSKKEMMFKSKVLAMAPLIYFLDEEGNFLRRGPLFWIKPNSITETPSLNDQSFTWATRVYKAFEFDAVNLLKGDKSYGDIFDLMMNDIRENAEKVHVAVVIDQDGNERYTPEELKNIGESVDTIITFDPDTFEEVVQVVHSTFDGNSLKKMRLMHDWVWNEDKKEISIVYLGFKPLIDRLDENGKLLHSGPMFIRRIGRDSL